MRGAEGPWLHEPHADAPPVRRLDVSELGPASWTDLPARVVCAGIRQPGAVDDSNEPVDLEVTRDEGVTVRFADGHVARVGLMALRLGCPFAPCRPEKRRIVNECVSTCILRWSPCI